MPGHRSAPACTQFPPRRVRARSRLPRLPHAIEQDAALPARERVLHEVADRPPRGERVRLVQQPIETGAEIGAHQLLARPRAENDADRLAHAGLQIRERAAGRGRRAPAAAAIRSTGAALQPSALAPLREGNADSDEEHPPEDQVEERQEDVQADEGADRDDREAEAADRANLDEPPPDGRALEQVFRITEQQVLQRRRQLEGDVRLERAQQVTVGDVGKRSGPAARRRLRTTVR